VYAIRITQKGSFMKRALFIKENIDKANAPILFGALFISLPNQPMVSLQSLCEVNLYP